MRRAVILALIVMLGTLGWAWYAHGPPAIRETSDGVSAAGVTLASQTLAVPEGTIAFPAGADGELLALDCTACHSPELILVQPPLGADKWQAEIDKMRKAYHATIDAKDDAALVAALGRLQARQGKGPT